MRPEQIQDKLVAISQPKHAAAVPSRAELDGWGIKTLIRNSGPATVALKVFGLLGMRIDDDVVRFVDEEQAGYLTEVADGIVDIEGVQRSLPSKNGIEMIFRNFSRLFEEEQGRNETETEIILPDSLEKAEALSSYIVGKAVLIDRGEPLPLNPVPDITPPTANLLEGLRNSA